MVRPDLLNDVSALDRLSFATDAFRFRPVFAGRNRRRHGADNDGSAHVSE